MSRFDALGIPEPPQKPLSTWLDLLTQWNKRIDLTAARSDDELYDLMLADAVKLAANRDSLPTDARVVDVGAGAGAPGLALALLRPDLKVTLVEPLTKRVSFLRTVIGTLNRTDIGLVKDRVEDFATAHANAFDVAISRATLAPAIWIPIALTMAPTAWALLARDEPPAIEGTIISEDITYAWHSRTQNGVLFAIRWYVSTLVR